MADTFYSKPIPVTDERVREALEKQTRQRLLREELDSQRAQQREARLKAGLPISSEPMTRAQRHRQRIQEERLEMQRKESEEARASPPHRGQIPVLLHGSSAASSTLPPLGPSVRGQGPLTHIRTPQDSLQIQREESVYHWNDPASKITNHHQGYGVNIAPSQDGPRPQVGINNTLGIPLPVTAEEAIIRTTLTIAPPPNASQAELAAWLADATEHIRKTRNPSNKDRNRSLGPATRGTNMEPETDEGESRRMVGRRDPTPQASTREARLKAMESNRLAKLEATLAGQAAEVSRLLQKQRDFEVKVIKLKDELKSAKQREKELSRVVQTRTTKEKRAETAPKPHMPHEPRETKGRDKRPITACVAEHEENNPSSLPPLPKEAKASYKLRKGLPNHPSTTTETTDSSSSPLVCPTSPPKTAAIPAVQGEPTQRQVVAAVTLEHLISLTETRLISHGQAHRLWELFAHASHSQKIREPSFAADEEFTAPLETFETYEDFASDEDEEYS